MCLKIGGWVRAEYGYGMNGSLGGPPVGGNVQNRTTNDSVFRARGYITADARNQTEYGTIRSYIAVGVSGSDVTGTPNNGPTTGAIFDANRAFIQFAGFTFGVTQSFYDFYSFPATGYIPDLYSDTGDSGWKVFAYTAQFGNGFSATVSAEMRRSTQIINATLEPAGFPGITLTPTTTSGATLVSTITGGGSLAALPGYGGFQSPDVVGNLRVDQAWGSAQIMGALHEVNAAYYGDGQGTLENSGNPSTAWGFAAGAGIKLLTPMIGAGDYFQTQVDYSQGALRYLWIAGDTNPYVQHGTSAAYGILSDAVMAASTTNTFGLELTTGWGVNAAYEHFWNTHWRTSIHGGYTALSYDDQANAILCALEGQSHHVPGIGPVAKVGCDNNWSEWAIGSRTQWNIDSSTYLGLDIAYTRIQSASSADGLLPHNGAAGATVAPTTTVCTLPGSHCTASDEGVWSARFRVHRDFYP
jgi:hypothetical protein